MSNEINIDKLFRMAEEDVEKAVTYELESDDSDLVKRIYIFLFYFYCEEKFSGDLIFSWKSPSLVKDGDYIKGFSQLRRRSLRNKKPPAMRVRDKS